jgi:ABC-type branched-subunit amino acid transport system ATPase component
MTDKPVTHSEYRHVIATGEIALEGPAHQLADDPKVIESYSGSGGAVHTAPSPSDSSAP